MVLRFPKNILPESKRHESKHLKKTNSNSAPLLKLLHLKHELFLLVLHSTRKMIGFKQTSNNSRNTVDMIRTIMEILVRLFFQSPCEVFLFNTYPYCSWNDTVYSSRCNKQVVEDSKIEVNSESYQQASACIFSPRLRQYGHPASVSTVCPKGLIYSTIRSVETFSNDYQEK